LKAEYRKVLVELARHPEFGVLVSLAVLAAAFTALAPTTFPTVASMYSILTLASELGVATLGVAFLMISGEFDLSVGSVYALVPMFVALMTNAGVDMLAASILMLAAAFGIGIVNGLITVKAGIPSFITTLGMMMFLRGILLAITGGFPVRLEKNTWFTWLLNGQVGMEGLRTGALWLVVLTAVFAFILDWTPYGNWTFAVGASADTARELGVPAERVKILNFGVSALMAGLAGLMAFSRFQIVDPTMGMGLELETITAAVLGGCLLTGGYGSMVGSFLGAVLIAMTRVGLVLAKAPAYWYRAFIGVILIIATVINMTLVKKFVTSG